MNRDRRTKLLDDVIFICARRGNYNRDLNDFRRRNK